MSTIFNGTIEHGMIRPDVPLDLPDGETVRVKILPMEQLPLGKLVADDEKFLDELMRSRSESRVWNNGDNQ